MANIFLSYARTDDKEFVQKLYNDLKDSGFNIWLDRASMPNRGITFNQEIADAIDQSDRLLLVLGPKAIESQYVNAEWNYALEKCKIIIPILRIGDYEIIPAALKDFHCPDFRASRDQKEAYAELLRILGDDILPPGTLWGVPTLPAHFTPLAEVLTKISNNLISAHDPPEMVPLSKRIMVLHGMPGVGKSVMAAAFASQCDTRRSFPDGVFWFDIGQSPTKTSMQKHFQFISTKMRGNSQGSSSTSDEATDLSALLESKRCLLILDNVWNINEITGFLNIVGPQCRMLITSRDSTIATATGSYDLKVVPEERNSLVLLASWCGVALNKLPPIAKNISEECGHLPFALALCGANIRAGISWQELLEAFSEADLGYLEARLPNYEFPNVLKAIEVSVNSLTPMTRRVYLGLAIFAKASYIPESVLRMFWSFHKGPQAINAGKILAELASKALIQTDGTSPNREIRLHDLYKDYLGAAVKNHRSLHSKLVSAYEAVSSGRWHTGPNDGYYYFFLPFHLKAAGRHDELKSLLLDFSWLYVKLHKTDIHSLINDFDLIGNSASHSHVRDCLRLSSSALALDPDQLASQILGRLAPNGDPEVLELLNSARRWNAKTWIRPIYNSFPRPEAGLKLTLRGHSDCVDALAITPDGKRVVSCSRKSSLIGSSQDEVFVWDIATGFRLRSWSHSGVNCLAIHPDGFRVFAGSDFGSLEVRNINSGELLTETSSLFRCSSLTVSKDGKFIGICNGWGGRLAVLDTQTLEPVIMREDYGGDGSALAFTNDNRKILYSDHNTLKVLDIYTGELTELNGHEGFIQFIAVHPEKNLIFTSSRDATIRVWDVEALKQISVYGPGIFDKGFDFEWSSKMAILSKYDLLIISERKGISIYRMDARNLVFSSPYPLFDLSTFELSQDERFLCAGYRDGQILGWDLTELNLSSNKWYKDRSSEHVGFRKAFIIPAINRFLLDSYDGYAVVGDLQNLNRVCDFRYTKQRSSIDQPLITQDGVHLIGLYKDTKVEGDQIWEVNDPVAYELSTGSLVNRLHAEYIIHSMAIIPRSTRVAISMGQGLLKIWDYISNTKLEKRVHDESVRALTSTPDGKDLIANLADAPIHIFDSENLSVKSVLEGEFHMPFFAHLAVSSDNRWLIGQRASNLLVWDLLSGKLLGNLHESGFRYPMRVFQHSTDGVLLVGTEVGVWALELPRLKEIYHFEESLTWVNDIGIDEKSKLAATGSADGKIVVWDYLSGNITAKLNTDSPIEFCALAPTSPKKIIAGHAGTVHFLELVEVSR